MRVLYDAWEQAEPGRGVVAAIGSFDGIHRGQRAVLERVVERASRRGLGSAVVTFDPHPSAVLRPENAPPRLCTPRQKEELLAGSGIDLLAIVRFTQELARVSAEAFVRDFLWGRLRALELHVGSRFRLGHERAGDLDLLRRLGSELGFRAFGVEEVLWAGEPISSTRIRQAVAGGRLDEAAAMLGREYSISGTVVHGDGRGRTLGWPTVNLDSRNELLPPDGVYASRVRLEGESTALDAVSNVGVRPTVSAGGERVAESHILDYEGDLYGRRLELEFHRCLRGERRFPSLAALARQIEADAAAAREYFAGGGCLKQQARADRR